MSRHSRRDFLKRSLGVAAIGWMPVIAPFPIRGRWAPSERIGFAFVGVGGMGQADIDRVLALGPAARITALCDVDRAHLRAATIKVNRAQKDDACFGSGDFRDVVTRADVDAVVIATPDHWHALPAILAARSKKDVYVEKPLTLTVGEGRALVDAVRANERIGQTGTQQRSEKNFRRACAAVRSGRIGALDKFEIQIPANNKFAAAAWAEEPVPEGFDYEFWLGPAPRAPFTRQRCHYNFRFVGDYALGQITNWGVHYIDIAQWMLGDAVFPRAVQGIGEYPQSGLFTNATRVDATAWYAVKGSANGLVQLTVKTRTDGVFDGSLKITGTEGEIFVTRSKLEASRPEILADLDEATILGRPERGHMVDFVESIRTRQPPVADVEYGHRSTTTCILADIAMKTRRWVEWDAAKETIKNDDTAARLLDRSMRAPWSLA